MNKADLIDLIAAKLGEDTTKAAAERALDAVTESFAEALAKDGTVQLVGFGTFAKTERAARDGRNPSTGEKIKIKASVNVKFKAGKALKEAVAPKPAKPTAKIAKK